MRGSHWPGWALASAFLPSKKPAAVYGAVGLTAVLLFWHLPPRLARITRPTHPEAFATLNAIRAQGLADKTVFVPRDQIPAMHYYFPHMQAEGYAELSEIPAAVAAIGIVYPNGRVESR